MYFSEILLLKLCQCDITGDKQWSDEAGKG